jgi:hypothetical protein
MAEPDKDLSCWKSFLSQAFAANALAKLLIEKGLITREEFMEKIFGGTGDVSEATKSIGLMNTDEITYLGIV